MTQSLHKGRVKFLLPYRLAAALLLPALALSAQNTDLVIQAGTTLNNIGGFTILKDVDIRCDGRWQATGGATLFTGDNATNLGGSGIIHSWDVEMVKSNPVTLTLNSGWQIASSLSFIRGLIDLNGQQLQLAGAAKLAGENDQGRIVGPNGGKTVAAATNIVSPSQLNLGNLGAMLTSTANLGTLTVTRSQLPVTSGGTGIQRTYLIQPQNNSALDATLRLYYLDAELNGNDATTLNLWKSTDGIGWTLTGADSRDTANHYVEKTQIADLSYWTMADVSNPLPLQLISFSAVCAGSYALIEWKTGMESQLSDFDVQRSADGTNWSSLGTVSALNAAGGATYSFKDVDPQANCYYRLKIADEDGKLTYSPVFHGGCSDIALPFLVFPNPASTQAMVQISVREVAAGKIRVIGISGQTVYESSWNLQPGLNQLMIPVSGWAAGSYLLQLVLPNGVQTTQLIKK